MWKIQACGNIGLKTSKLPLKIKQWGTKFCFRNKQQLSNDLKISKIVKGLLIYGVAYKTEKVYVSEKLTAVE